MTGTEVLGIVGAIVGILTGILSVASVVYLAGSKMTRVETRMEDIETKVGIIWEFLLRRAMGEAVLKGVATINSPLIITSEAKSWLDPLKPALQAKYLSSWQKLSDRDLLLAIEKEFGSQLAKDVCIPRHLNSGACLLIAMQVAREANQSPVEVSESLQKLVDELTGSTLVLPAKVRHK